MTPSTITLRPEGPEDADFLARLFAVDAGGLLRGAFLPEVAVAQLVSMQLRARDAGYRAAYPEARFGIVECGGAPTGRLVEADLPGLVHVIDVAIDPAGRRQGLAAALLRQAMARWAIRGRGGRAAVVVSNKAALALFASLGFTGQTEPGAAQVTMTWRPPA